MEEGSFRCDANVSVRPAGSTELGTKVEIKNMNSFRAVEKAIAYELRRQAAALERGDRLVQETRLWDAGREETRPMRSQAHPPAYRPLPEPDLHPPAGHAPGAAPARDALPRPPRPAQHPSLPLHHP